MTRSTIVLLGLTAVASAQSGRSYGPGRTWWDAGSGAVMPWEESYDNPDGLVSVFNRKGAVRTQDHPFFEALGTNRRACITCHQPANAMSLAAATLRERWRESEGKDPVFAAIDGANCPNLPPADIRSHSLLLDRGVFRIFLPWPPKEKPEFRIEVVRDPTGCALTHGMISVYRRPRMPANLDALVAGPDGPVLMADGREPDLRAQAMSAVLGHEQAVSQPSEARLRQIVEFESQLYAAQGADIRGGLLNEREGPAVLGPDNLAAGKTGARELLQNTSLFDAWRKPAGVADMGVQLEFRASVARGSDIFAARCAGCHSPGSTRWMDIGTANRVPEKAAADLPLFRITCETTGEVTYTQDPGRALISGKCVDLGAIVVPQLRGLAARAPYFSNGSAQTLRDVVEFYEGRFGLKYSEAQKRDLVNFLKVL